MRTSVEAVSCCFDEESERMLKDFRKKGLRKASRVILADLTSRGLKGTTSLELGCGVGGLTVGLLDGGVVAATGLDLSPKMIEVANKLAKESGFMGSATFEVGDGADVPLIRADTVILDSVLCCYPDVGRLVQNSCSAAKKFYAISLPDSRRTVTKLLRRFLPLQSLFRRKSGFRFYVPSLDEILLVLKKNGFTCVFDSAAGYTWSVLVFAADPLRN